MKIDFAGKKTYLCAAAMVGGWFAWVFGYVTQEQFMALESLLLPLGLAALRAGVGKI